MKSQVSGNATLSRDSVCLYKNGVWSNALTKLETKRGTCFLIARRWKSRTNVAGSARLCRRSSRPFVTSEGE